MILIILVAGSLATTIPEDKDHTLSCKSNKDDITNGVYFMAALTVVITLVFIVFFRPKYLRMEAEQRDKLIESSNHN